MIFHSASGHPTDAKGPVIFFVSADNVRRMKRRRYSQEHEEERARDGPEKRTRSNTQKPAPAVAQTTTKTTIARRKHPISPLNSPSCPMEASDGSSTHFGICRCDDGSDKSIDYPALANTVALKGIGSLTEIEPVRIQVALKESVEPATFTFSRTWIVPLLVMKLSAGRMALLNVTFLFTNDEMACEDLLVGLPVLPHLGIDSRTLLEHNWHNLNETDCAYINTHPRHDTAGYLSRLMIARLQNSDPVFGTAPDPSRPRSNYFDNQKNVDTFSEPFVHQ